MKRMLSALCIAFSMCRSTCALAGGTPIPSDLSVELAAAPNTDLQSGQRIAFTVSVTNHGPEPVYGLGVQSSPIYDELDVFSTQLSSCQGDMVLAVADLENSFYFLFNYYVVRPDTPPLEVGETRTCELSLEYTPWAPAIFPVSFNMPGFLDLDPSNNEGRVILRRAIVAHPVPVGSELWLGMLAALLSAAAWIARSRSARVTHTEGIRSLQYLRGPLD